MHDDDNRFQRFVPLLRRVIILLAVLAATPVVLWMITTFVRAYVGPAENPRATSDCFDPADGRAGNRRRKHAELRSVDQGCRYHRLDDGRHRNHVRSARRCLSQGIDARRSAVRGRQFADHRACPFDAVAVSNFSGSSRRSTDWPSACGKHYDR